MIFDRGAETMLPFFGATDIARELESVYRKSVNWRRIDSSRDYGGYDDTIPSAGLSKEQAGIDKDMESFSKTNPDKQKIELETLRIPLYINRLSRKIYFGKLGNNT